ncbi:MAG: hypothetical protein CMJ95_10640 [Planctomycetes bacterium]|nr:hypothetical protein [Planctomycetota bacterium]
MSTATFTVTVNDNEDPVVVPGAAIVVTGDGASCTFAVTVPLPSVSDNCGIDGVTNDFNSLPDASGDFPYGTTSIGWFAFDVNGNLGSALGTQTITVNPPIDCNGNDESDGCDISNGTSQDCNSNGIPDECDIAAATSFDNNSNGVPDECEVEFVRGDANNNGNVNVADAYWILLHVFFDLALDCNDAADVNNDGAINLSDAIYMYSALVGFGPVPPPPFPDCGLDTGDNLGCDNFDSCP